MVTAFTCSMPDPWNFVSNTKCIDVVAFVKYISITNIVSEVLLILGPLAIWNVKMSRAQTGTICSVFLARFG